MCIGESDFLCFLATVKQGNGVLASLSGQEKVLSSNIFTSSLAAGESKVNWFILAIAQYVPSPLRCSENNVSRRYTS